MAIDTDETTGEQWTQATVLADIGRGQTGPVQIDGIGSDTAFACHCGPHDQYAASESVDLYRPTSNAQWHIAGKTSDRR